MSDLVPEIQRQFAQEIVGRLHEAGFEAYWAGGCVRDRLLKRTPHDYDVATSATPEQVRQLFGPRRTLPVGMAFGVVIVLGPDRAGQVEVATFRSDFDYHDGRHPRHVAFSSAREDALRRDFTINGLFYDPLEDRVIDFVGGRADLQAGLVRAIGNPADRLAEDKLRMLRAARFAISQMASQVTIVSAERIADEMGKMLVSPKRTVAVRLLLETGLADEVLPEIVPADAEQKDQLEKTFEVLDRLDRPSLPLALAALLADRARPDEVGRVCRRWRLSNHLTDRAEWLAAHHGCLKDAQLARWSVLQKILVSPGIEELLEWTEVEAAAQRREAPEVDYCRTWLAQPPEKLDPPPLVTGDDLLRHGVAPGPIFGELLARLRDAQLDSRIETKAEGLVMLDRLMAEEDLPENDQA